MDFELSVNTKKYLLTEAKRAIATEFGLTFSNNVVPDTDAKSECGAFVTIHKNGRLRGCIGYIQATGPLDESIRYLAKEAAFSDHRFSPLTKNEFHEIDIEITVLSPMKETTPEEITVGRDGLFITKGTRCGVLLPQVATEYKWDKFTFLNQTCIKAGLEPNAWKSDAVKIFRFEGNIFGDADTCENRTT